MAYRFPESMARNDNRDSRSQESDRYEPSSHSPSGLEGSMLFKGTSFSDGEIDACPLLHWPPTDSPFPTVNGLPSPTSPTRPTPPRPKTTPPCPRYSSPPPPSPPPTTPVQQAQCRPPQLLSHNRPAVHPAAYDGQQVPPPVRVPPQRQPRVSSASQYVRGSGVSSATAPAPVLATSVTQERTDRNSSGLSRSASLAAAPTPGRRERTKSASASSRRRPISPPPQLPLSPPFNKDSSSHQASWHRSRTPGQSSYYSSEAHGGSERSMIYQVQPDTQYSAGSTPNGFNYAQNTYYASQTHYGNYYRGPVDSLMTGLAPQMADVPPRPMAPVPPPSVHSRFLQQHTGGQSQASGVSYHRRRSGSVSSTRSDKRVNYRNDVVPPMPVPRMPDYTTTRAVERNHGACASCGCSGKATQTLNFYVEGDCVVYPPCQCMVPQNASNSKGRLMSMVKKILTGKPRDPEYVPVYR